SEDIALGEANGGMDMKDQRVESVACWWAERILSQAVGSAAPPGLGKRPTQRIISYIKQRLQASRGQGAARYTKYRCKGITVFWAHWN
ncbi:MAG: hypothetical protein ACKPKO_22070, partial [Candidatus Fonsibacter sp.]